MLSAASHVNPDTHVSTPTLDGVNSFLSRLALERPFFDVSAALGVAIMRLYRDLAMADLAALERVCSLDAVRESIGVALELFKPDGIATATRAEFIQLKRVKALQDSRGFKTPEQVFLPKTRLDDLYVSGNSHAAALMSQLRRESGT